VKQTKFYHVANTDILLVTQNWRYSVASFKFRYQYQSV